MTLRPDYQLTEAEANRADILWLDPEMVSEALQDPPCFEYRGPRGGTPAVRTGAKCIAALAAYNLNRSHENAQAFASLVLADVRAILNERAVDELADEEDEA